MASLSIATARTAPAAYRQAFAALAWPQQYAHVRSLGLDDLRAHGEALGQGAPWSLGLKIGADLRPRSADCDVGYNSREHAYTSAEALATWFAGQHTQVLRGGCRLVGCMLSLPHEIALAAEEEALVTFLRDTLPGLGWQPTWLWLNTVGYSDRGEPPEPSASLRIFGKILGVRWPTLEGVEFQSTVVMLVPTDAAAWVARITALTQRLRLGLKTV